MANNIVVDIVADTRSLVRGVNETNAKLNSLNGSVSKISGAFKGIAAAFGLQVGISWFKDAIKGAEEEKKSFAALATEYGDEADAIVAKVNGMSKKFYVDDGTIAQLVLDLRGKLRAELDGLALDLAAGTINLARLTNQPIEELSAKMQKVVKDGKVTMTELQQLGVHLNEEQQKSFDAAVKSGTTVQWLTDYLTSEEYQKKALAMVTPFEKLSKTMQDVKDAVGDALLKVFEKLFDFFTDTDKNGLTKANGNFKDMKDILFAVGGFLIIAKIVTPIIMWTKAVQGLTAANILLNIAMNANPVGLIILGIAALIAIVILVINHWDDLGKAFKDFADKFVGFFKGIGKIFQDAFKGVSFSGLFDAFKQMITNILNFAKGIGGTFLQIGKDIVQGMINGIGSMISSAINAVKNVASAITNGIKNALGINSPSRVFMAVGSGLTEGLIKGIDKTAYLAVNSVKDLGKSLQIPMELSPVGGLGYATTSSAQPITVNITAGLGTDSYELGRVVSAALEKYAGVNGR
jgi:methyl-accepting chemotaxis protein